MPTSAWRGTSFLSIDPGISHTGYAHYRVPMDGDIKLMLCGRISPPKTYKDYERITYIVGMLDNILIARKPSFAFLEWPPSTVYQQKREKLSKSIGRATRIYTLMAIVGALHTLLAYHRNIPVRHVLPVNWQQRSKDKRNGLEIKDWSLQYANEIIKDKSFIAEHPPLSTQAEENIADAISLGYRSFALGLAP